MKTTNGRFRAARAVKCRRCGKILTSEKSIRAGIGPVCATKIKRQ